MEERGFTEDIDDGDEAMRGLDAVIEAIRQRARQFPDGEIIRILDRGRLYQMQFAAIAMKRKALEYPEALKITVSQSEVTPDYGSVRIEGPDICVKDMKWFGRATEFADDVEIYPLANGNIRLELTFRHLLRRIGSSSRPATPQSPNNPQ